jgi:hypothetical protein
VTSLILALLTVRRAQTLIVTLLAVLATAGAVAGPAYRLTAERAVVDAEVTTSSPLERSVQINSGVGRWTPQDFAARIESQVALAGFTTVYAAEYNVAARFGTRVAIPRFSYRDDVCAHVALRAGRCPSGAREVILGRQTAEGLGVDVGAEVPFASARYIVGDGWQAGKTWTDLTLVGIYDPIDPSEPYWAGRSYFGGTERAAPEPAFIAEPTLQLVEHEIVSYTADLVAGPDTFTPARIATLRADLDQLRLRMTAMRATVTTDVPALVTRIESSVALVGRVVPIAAVPLILLCWFIVYLTVAYATEQRRAEFGLFALRGLPLGQRWALAFGPTVVPVLIGAPIGYVLGHVAVSAFGAATLPVSASVPVGTGYLGYAALAVAGALLAGAWAQRQLFRSSVGPLVRRVPPRVRTAGSLTAVVVAVVLAVVAVAQLRASGGELTGIALLGPALVALAVALAVAHLLVPVSRRAGRRALLRGRLGPALAALRMARRPGTQRLLAFVTVAVALLGFAVIAASVGADRRSDRAGTELGAPRVVPVAPVAAATLLAATRKADPDGRFAMAVVTIDPPEGMTADPVVAVDSGRLAAVTAWPGDASIGAAEAARRLRPATAEPVVVTGTALRVDVTVTSLARVPSVPLRATLTTGDGRPEKIVELGDIRPGRATYTADLAGCAAGCRLASVEIRQPGQVDFDARLVVHGITQTGPDRDVVTGDQLAAWLPTKQTRPVDKLSISRAADGLAVEVTAGTLGTLDARVRPPDAAYPVPALAAGSTRPDLTDLSSLDRRREPAALVGRSPRLPRIGTVGALVDLEFMDRVARTAAVATNAEVWLGPRAPADALDRLRAAGLVLGTERSLARMETALSQQGPAVALRFHVATGGLALLLAIGAVLLVAAIDRADRSDELRALRAQGLRRRDAAVYTRRGYLWVVAVAVVAGTAGALAAWVAVGPFVPQFADRTPDGTLYWPTPVAVLAVAVVSAVALAGAAVMAGGGRSIRGFR